MRFLLQGIDLQIQEGESGVVACFHLVRTCDPFNFKVDSQFKGANIRLGWEQKVTSPSLCDDES